MTSITNYSRSASEDTDVTATTTSSVDSTQTTDDFHKRTRAFVDGEFVETRIYEIAGDFDTQATMTSSTQTDNDWTYSLNQTSTAYPGGPPTGTTIQSSGTFSDSTQNTTTTVAEQSGSYDSEGTNSSSSSISVTAVDQYFSESDGESHLHNGTYTLDTVSSRDSQWSTESTSLRQESFSDAGDAASWETTYEFDSSWSTHQALTEYGNTVNVDYSGSDSGSNSSGSQTYTPKAEDNPNEHYDGRIGTFHERGGSGSGSSSQAGEGNAAASGDIYYGHPDYMWFVALRTKSGELILVPAAIYHAAVAQKDPRLKELEVVGAVGINRKEWQQQREIDAIARAVKNRDRQEQEANRPKVGNDPAGEKRNALIAEFKSKEFVFEWQYKRAQDKLERDLFYAGVSDEFRKWHEYNSGLWSHHDDFMDAVEWEQFTAEAKANAYAAMGGMAGVAGSSNARTMARSHAAVRTNDQLVRDIAARAQAWGNRKGLGVAGIKKHSYAQDLLNRYQRMYGNRGLSTEVRYLNGQLWEQGMGLRGTVKLDVVEGPLNAPTSVWDYKFGKAGLSNVRITRIQNGAGLPPTFIIIEVRP